MKRAVSISRIVTCVTASLYTLVVCYHVVQNVRYACWRITPIGEEYVMGFDSITPYAWFYIISGVALLALCAVTLIFLFRKGWLAAMIAGVAIVTSAIYGLCLNTMLSEVMLWREPMRKLGIYGVELYLAIKPLLACLCIHAAVCYVILCFVAYRKELKPISVDAIDNITIP